MSDLIMLLLAIGLFIYFLFSKKKKRALAISAVVIVAYMLLVRFTCGPNSKDVAIMRPMAEKISEYIVANGIPTSLKDIPGLPYGLECRKKNGNNCSFEVGNYNYSINFYKPSYGGYELKLFSDNKTGYKVYFNTNKNNELTSNKNDSGAYSTKTSGICNPMRQ